MSATQRLAAFLPGGKSRLAIPLIIIGVIVLALFSPAQVDETFDPRLSTTIAGPNGAKGFHDVLKRLGWRTEQRRVNPFEVADSGTILAVLAPPIPLSDREISLLLSRVREGTSLLAVIQNGTPLEDSLHLSVAPALYTFLRPPQGLKCQASESQTRLRFWGPEARMRPFERASQPPPGSTIFAKSGAFADKAALYGAVGFALGKGRVVAISDANLLRNDFMRVCQWGVGVVAVQLVEYLSAGRPRSATQIVFDEFHHELGPQPSVNRAVARMLFSTAPGAMIVQVLIAALFLVFARAPRPIAPVAVHRVQRRSQFEHVEALSLAYRQISATRLVAEKLVRGLRRRLGVSMSSLRGQTEDDDSFLRQVASSHPQLVAEVNTVAAALHRQSVPSGLLDAVAAIETIERTIKR